jgi:hypothetical protein
LWDFREESDDDDGDAPADGEGRQTRDSGPKIDSLGVGALSWAIDLELPLVINGERFQRPAEPEALARNIFGPDHRHWR